jgi:dihydroorotate dehydrogenase
MRLELGIGLAGGIDKDGSRAAELLAAGFASVEFGSVAAGGSDYPDASAATLAANLAAWRTSHLHTAAPRIGVGISRPAGAPLEALPDCWLAGLEALAGVADYVSFNLTAAANRPLLTAEQQPLLARSFAAVVARRDALAAKGRRVELAVKLPLGAPGEPLPGIALLAAVAGFAHLAVVRADNAPDFSRITSLARRLPRVRLVAIGGIRSAADVGAARAAGAAGVQVHRAFAEQGAACLIALRGEM